MLRPPAMRQREVPDRWRQRQRPSVRSPARACAPPGRSLPSVRAAPQRAFRCGDWRTTRFRQVALLARPIPARIDRRPRRDSRARAGAGAARRCWPLRRVRCRNRLPVSGLRARQPLRPATKADSSRRRSARRPNGASARSAVTAQLTGKLPCAGNAAERDERRLLQVRPHRLSGFAQDRLRRRADRPRSETRARGYARTRRAWRCLPPSPLRREPRPRQTR